jgi:uncharacterized membrane protein
VTEPRTLGAPRQLAVGLPLARVRARALAALPFALATAAACGYALASVFRHDRFGSNAKDLGVYDQTIWGYSHLKMVVNTVTLSPNLLGDHFNPILMGLAPLFWIWDDVRMLLIAQALLLALASLPIFLWARRELGTAAAFLFQGAYLVFWGVLGGDLFDFHEVAIAAPTISFALYAVLTRRNLLLWAMAIVAFLTKEDLALTIAALGVYVMVTQRRYRLGGALVGVSIPWFLLVLKAIIPAISDRSYAHWTYTALGSGPGDAARHLVRHPVDSVRLFVEPATKRTALVNLFAPWLFLPLLSPLVIVMIPSLAERFLSDRPEFWAQGFHYSLTISPILAFAAIDSTARIGRWVGTDRLRLLAPGAGALVLLAGLYFSFGRLKPLDELRRYTSAQHAAEISACLRRIPPDAQVSATSALVPHVSHRPTLFLLDGTRPRPTRYLAIDTYTWIFPLDVRGVRTLIDDAFGRGYGVMCTKAGTVVLERGAPSRRLSPELRRQLASA